MSVPGLLRFQDDGSIVYLDGLVNADVLDDVLITMHAIEGGSTISDHAQARPRQVQMVVEVSESPAPSATEVTTTGPDRVTQVLDALDAGVGRLVDLVIQGRRTYPNLLLGSRGNAAWDQYRRVRLSIPATQVTVTSSVDEVLEVDPARASDDVRAGASETDSGQTSTRRKTIGAAVVDGVGGLLR